MPQMTATQCARFLTELEVSGNVMFACVAADVSRQQAYTEREEQPSFELAWRASAARAGKAAAARALGMVTV